MTSRLLLAWNVPLAPHRPWLVSLGHVVTISVVLSHVSLLFRFQSVDYREEDLLPDRRLAQHPGGVDQGPAEHPQGPGQQPGYRGDRSQAHREGLAHKGQEESRCITSST